MEMDEMDEMEMDEKDGMRNWFSNYGNLRIKKLMCKINFV